MKESNVQAAQALRGRDAPFNAQCTERERDRTDREAARHSGYMARRSLQNMPGRNASAALDGPSSLEGSCYDSRAVIMKALAQTCSLRLETSRTAPVWAPGRRRPAALMAFRPAAAFNPARLKGTAAVKEKERECGCQVANGA